MNHSIRILGVVLCGGQSTRMGRDKATLLIDHGKDFLQHAIDRLMMVCEEVCVSASKDRDSPVPLIADPEESFGPMTGIIRSLHYANQHRYDACLFNPVDTPYLTERDLESLIDSFANYPKSIVCALSGKSDRLEPLIAIYPVTALEPLNHACESAQHSLKKFLRTQAVQPVRLSAAVCHNINRPEDLKR